MNTISQETERQENFVICGRPHRHINLRAAGWQIKLSKRLFDVLFALVALVFAAPFLMCVALAVRLDSPGPVLFRQMRTGLNGKAFKIYKIRTLRSVEEGRHVQQVARDDSRITRVGRILRRTSIDELPQLWNVVRGEMSLVGPRPHAVAHDEHYSRCVPDYARRFEMPPGLTGWAQVNKSRGSINGVEEMRHRVDLDLWYIRNHSFWLDLRIIAKTLYLEMTGKTDAY